MRTTMRIGGVRLGAASVLRLTTCCSTVPVVWPGVPSMQAPLVDLELTFAPEKGPSCSSLRGSEFEHQCRLDDWCRYGMGLGITGPLAPSIFMSILATLTSIITGQT